MIVAHVQFPVEISDKQLFIDQMAKTTPKYEGLDGLVRKYYMIGDAGDRASGLYLWESRAQAAAWYDDEWIKYMTEAWGEAPKIDFFDCPIIVDNALNKTTIDK